MSNRPSGCCRACNQSRAARTGGSSAVKLRKDSESSAETMSVNQKGYETFSQKPLSRRSMYLSDLKNRDLRLAAKGVLGGSLNGRVSSVEAVFLHVLPPLAPAARSCA